MDGGPPPRPVPDPHDPPPPAPSPPLEYRRPARDVAPRVSVPAVISFSLALVVLAPCLMPFFDRRGGPPVGLPAAVVVLAALGAAAAAFAALQTDASVKRGEMRGLWMAWFGLFVGLSVVCVWGYIMLVRYGMGG